MVLINTLFLSGWFQLILLVTIFTVYSRRVLHLNLKYGYMLGLLIGLFFMFSYTALNPPQSFYLSAYDYELNIIQIIFASGLGMMFGVIIVIVSVLFRNNFTQQSLSTAAISGIFMIAIFMQLIAVPDVRLMVSLFVLAFGIVVLSSHIMLRRRNLRIDKSDDAVATGDVGGVHKSPSSRLEEIRQRVVRARNNRNDVSDYPQTL